MKRNTIAVAGLILGLTAASALEAQVARPVTFGIGAGISFPTGDGSDGTDNGYHFQGMIGFRAPLFPVGLRADVMYHTFDQSGNFGGVQVDGSTDILAGTVNAHFDMGGMMAAPYLTGGIGAYNVKFDFSALGESESGSETDFGFNGGGGVRFNLSGFNTFLEARYHHILSEGGATKMIPITFGIMF